MGIANNILIVGAGKSSGYLINTLLKASRRKQNKWNIIIADNDENALILKVRDFPAAETVVLDINNEAQRQKLVKRASIVVSLMPPQLHILLAKDCLQFGKHLITSSYASPEMRELDKHAREAGLMFMCEMGLDPGIDHMTASMMFDSIRRVGSHITSFESYCGGLVAPESDTNPWHYKFSWNPKNIITAGMDGAHYLADNVPVHIGYDKMFHNNKKIYCEGVGQLAYYANRDSLSYIDLYELQEAKTFMRATLRHPDFCKGWDMLIRMGLTNMEPAFDTNNMTNDSWIAAVTGYDNSSSLSEFVWDKFDIHEKKLREMIEWLDLFEPIPLRTGYKSSGDILLDILSRKWAMQHDDKDMVVMQHEVNYEYKGNPTHLVSSMVVKGEDSEFSAMAKTVGLPMAILTELVINEQIRVPHGVLIPTMPQIYRPVLNRLVRYGIEFTDYVSTPA